MKKILILLSFITISAKAQYTISTPISNDSLSGLRRVVIWKAMHEELDPNLQYPYYLVVFKISYRSPNGFEVFSRDVTYRTDNPYDTLNSKRNYMISASEWRTLDPIKDPTVRNLPEWKTAVPEFSFLFALKNLTVLPITVAQFDIQIILDLDGKKLFNK